MGSARRLVCAVALVLAAAVCVAQTQDRIKMCGRELVRVAVSSCGNSRLRRSISENWADSEPEQDDHTPHWDHNPSVEEEEAPQTPTDGERNVFTVAPHWYPASFRIRRASGKISDICCEKGCSLKELIQFC